MTLNILDATNYLRDYFIQNEEWIKAEDEKKQRILNVAERTIMSKYPSYIIPENAIFEFAGVLSLLQNDIFKYQFLGVKSFSITGEASFTFENGQMSVEALIPPESLKLIEEANGIVLIGKRKFGKVR